MKPLAPPDSLHLQAAQGWCELHAFVEADAELDNIFPAGFGGACDALRL